MLNLAQIYKFLAARYDRLERRAVIVDRSRSIFTTRCVLNPNLIDAIFFFFSRKYWMHSSERGTIWVWFIFIRNIRYHGNFKVYRLLIKYEFYPVTIISMKKKKDFLTPSLLLHQKWARCSKETRVWVFLFFFLYRCEIFDNITMRFVWCNFKEYRLIKYEFYHVSLILSLLLCQKCARFSKERSSAANNVSQLELLWRCLLKKKKEELTTKTKYRRFQRKMNNDTRHLMQTASS